MKSPARTRQAAVPPVAGLSDPELLGLLLGGRCGPRPATTVATELLAHFGGLRALFAAPLQALEGRHGLGPAAARRLQAVPELARRCLAETVERGQAMECPETTGSYLKTVLRDRPHEVFACLFLDTRHRVIAFEELFRGTIDGATVYPRVVAEKALRYGAAALIAAHNHPSGISEPSLADQAITRRLKDALALLDIRLLDHFVVGDGAPVSMAARGLV
jgi:DNA repair protein RadC